MLQVESYSASKEQAVGSLDFAIVKSGLSHHKVTLEVPGIETLAGCFEQSADQRQQKQAVGRIPAFIAHGNVSTTELSICLNEREWIWDRRAC